MVSRQLILISPTGNLDKCLEVVDPLLRAPFSIPAVISIRFSDRSGVSLDEHISAAKHLFVRYAQRHLNLDQLSSSNGTPNELFDRFWKLERVNASFLSLNDLANRAGETVVIELPPAQQQVVNDQD